MIEKKHTVFKAHKHTLNGKAVAVCLNAIISMETLKIKQIDIMNKNIFLGHDSVYLSSDCCCFGEIDMSGDFSKWP